MSEAISKCVKYRGDYIGMRFGSLVVVRYPTNKRGQRMAGCYCQCDCGEEVFVSSVGKLFRGAVTNCRICGRKAISEATKLRWKTNPPVRKKSKYGELRNERLYRVWTSMKQRCRSEYGSYADVSMCDEWMDYRKFREWAYSHGYDDEAPRGECTIDRINPFGNYEPGNCRFISMREQAKNKRSKWALLDEETRQAIVETTLASE